MSYPIKARSWRVVFANHTYTGATAISILRQLANDQWQDMNKHGLKTALAWRAFVLDSVLLDNYLRADLFLSELGQTSLAEVWIESPVTHHWERLGVIK